VQSFTGSSSLELVVQSLAPVLLAELAKLKAASSSSAASSKEKKPSSSSSRDEQKQSSSSSRDEKKPSSSSSSRDVQKQSSSSSRDEKKPSSSSSSKDEQKQSSSSSRDEKKPSSSASSRDEQKPSSSSSRDEKKPSSSSSSRDEQKQASTYLTKGGNEPPLSSSSVKGIKKVLVKKSVPTKSAKPPGSGLLGFVPAHPPLLLSGLPSTVTQQQVFSAVEKFGKSRLISVAQQRQEATVYFLQEAAAHALLGFTELKIGGNPITVTQKAVQCNKTTALGIKTTTPGTKGTTPGNKKATPGNATTTPGNKTTTPGNKKATPGNTTTIPGNKTTTPGNKTTTPGNKTTMHANKTPTPSKSTITPDDKVTTPGNNTATTGKKTAPSGTEPIMPGNEAAIPDNTTATPVKKTTMPSNTTTVPGSTTTPGNKTATPGNKSATPGNKSAMPGIKKATPGNTTTIPGNKKAIPGNTTTIPVNKTTTHGKKTTMHANKTPTPSKSTTTPDNKVTTPGYNTATPGKKTAPPGTGTIMPGNEAAIPDNTTATPVKKTTMPSNSTTVPGSTTTPGNKTATPGNKSATPGNKSATPGSTTMPSKKVTPGNTKTTAVNKTATPGNKMAPPVNVTITPGGDTTTTGNTTTMSENKTPTSSNITPTPDNKAIELSNNTDMQGDTRTMPVQPVAPPSLVAKVFPTVLFLKSIQCLDVRCWKWKDFLPYATSGATIMVTDLPEMECNASTWSSITQVLEKFGNVQCDKCFILPENCTAFVSMIANKVAALMESLVMGASLNSKTVRCHLLKENALESPIDFYKHLLRWSEKLYDESTLEYRLVYISNIPVNNYWMLAFNEGLRQTGGVRLYLPLIGKIFVEFVTVEDADRFGVWLSKFRPSKLKRWRICFSRPGLDQDVYELFKAGREDAFLITLFTQTVFYPTLSPQFYTPAHRTVNGPEDLEWAGKHLTGQSVVMVTGLALGTYRHMDLVDEVWPYFVEKDISRVYYSVVILPLQRRAFIHFDDALKCKEFVSDFLHKPFTIGGSDLTLHFLLDHLKPCTSELQLYNRLLQWTNVVCNKADHQDQLILKEMDYCNREELRFIFKDILKSTSPNNWVSCLVLGNRVVFQIVNGRPDITWMNKLLNMLNAKKGRTQGQYGKNREVWKSVNDFTSGIQKIDVRTVINSPQHAKSGQSPPDPSGPGPSGPGPSAPGPSGPGTLAAGPSGPALLTPVAPAELGASAHDQDWPPGSGPQPPALSQEMYLFFATAIHQHRQARVEQEVRRGGQEGSQREVSKDLDKTTSSSTTAHSSSLSGATVSSSHLPKSSSSSSDLPKSSSSSTSSSLPPPAGVVPSSSEQNTQQKCEESPVQVSEAVDTTHTPSPTSQEGSRITTTEEAESLPACPPITRKEVLSVAAMVCEDDMARPGHMMAAETSLKSAASLTGKDVLQTDPCLEEEGKRKAQQELTLTGKDVVVSPSEDMKENRVEVDETHQQLGDEKTSDQMLHSRPECGEETPHQTPVQPETPGLPDPESQTSEPQEEEMLAKVADEAEPFQDVPEHKETILEERKNTIVEEQMPSVNEETPSVVSEAADALLNGALTEEGDTNQLMDCVEGSPPKEEEQKTKETQEEQKTQETPEEEQKTKETQEEQKTNEQSNKEEQRGKEVQTNKELKEEEQRNKEPTEVEQGRKDPTEQEQGNNDPTEEEIKKKEPTEKGQNSREQSIKEEQNTKVEKNIKEPPEEEQGNKEQSNEAPTEGADNKGPAVEEGAPEMDQRRSKRGHPSPVPPSTKPLSTRRSTRHSTPTMKRESPGELPVEKAVSVEVEASSSPRGGESPSSGAHLPQGHPHPKEEEVEYQVTDSVEGEVVEGVQLPTRRKRGRPTKQTAKNVRVKKEQPTAPVAEESGKKPEEPLENQAGPTRKETKPQEAPEEKSRGKEDGAEESQMADIVTPSNAKPRVSDEGVSLEEVATYQVLDSVEELEVKEGPPVTKGTRGRGRKAKTPTRKECKRSLEETVFEVLDSIGGDVVEDAPAPEQPGRPRRGLGNKDPTPEKDGKVVPDDTPEGKHGKQEQVEKEEELARPVVEEPQGDEQPAAGKRRSGRGRKEEVAVSGTSKMAAKEGQQRVKDSEEVYQVVDSTEDDPHEEEHVDPPGPRRRSKRRDPAPAVTRATRRPAYSTQGEEPLYQVVDSVGGEEEPAPVEEQPPGLEPRRGKRGGTVAGSDSATEDKAAKKMKTTEQTVTPKVNEGVGAKKAMDGRKASQEQEENALVSLDEVSEEEEDYPDDSVEEEELRKRQAVEERRREEEEEERKLGEGMEGLVTLDEVGEEEEEEEVDEEEVGHGGEAESGRRAGGITEEELQALVTLDEIVEEEQEGEEPTHSEPLPDNQSEARLNTETVCDKEKASSSIVGECKQSEEQAEECVSFVTLDEVGYEEEETQPHSKRGRQATERKCTRREQQQPAMAKPSGEESPPIPAHATSLLACEPGAVLSVKGAEPIAESPARDGEETGSEETRLLRKASSKARREEEEAEPKRVRSRSPSVANNYTLPAFTPNNPLGSEHVVPGFYCNLCSVFYKNETSARTLHCSRLGHYNNLKKYYQGLQEEQSRSQSGGSTAGNSPKRL
ncbi:unnamed protein product, partial [Arctogadus glacialis]